MKKEITSEKRIRIIKAVIVYALVIILFKYAFPYINKTINESMRKKTQTEKTIFYEIHSQEDFDEKVVKSKEKVLVEYYATWCKYCPKQREELEKIAKSNEKKFKIYLIDVEHINNFSDKDKIKSLPTLRFFNEGKEIKTLIGLQDAETIKKVFEK